MAYNHEYPYVDAQLFNDDWLIMQVKKLVEEFAEFVNLNTIKYADPISWDITRQYEKNTVVVDSRTGNAYISTKPVPAGVQIDNTNYWTGIYNYSAVIDRILDQIATNEGNSTTATKTYSVGDLVFVNEKLYRVIAPMIAGDSFVLNSNIVKTTIEAELHAFISQLSTLNEKLGDLDDLNTTDKTDVVAAINEVLLTAQTLVGDLADLDTTDKTDVVAAINEVVSSIASIVGDLGDLNTTDKSNVVAAINEILADISSIDVELNYADVKKYGAVGDGTTDDTAAFEAAIASGLEVYVPKGTYYLPNGLTLTGVNKSIRGAGRGLTKLKADGSHNLFTCSSLTHFSIKQLGITNAAVAIELHTNTAWGTIEDIEIKDCVKGIYAHGNYFPSPTNDVIEVHINNVSYLATSGSVTAFHFYCTGDIWLTDCMAQTNTDAGTALYVDTGVSALYCKGCNFIGNYHACRVENAHNPASNTGGRPAPPHDIFFTACLFDSSTYTAVWKNVYNITAVDCWFGGSGHSGLQVEAVVTGITISACRILSNAEHGIWFVLTTRNCHSIITDNKVYSNGNYGINLNYSQNVIVGNNNLWSNTDGGIMINSDCFDIAAVGNVCQSIGNTSGASRRCYAMANIPIDQNNSAGYTEPSTP